MTATAGLTQNKVIGSTIDIPTCDIRPPAQAAGAFSSLRGACVAKRGRPKKDGARFPGGQLRPSVDRGHELTLHHRAVATRGANPNDSRASYPLGVLRLRGEIDDAEHQAGLAFGFIRAIAGPRGGRGETSIDAAAWGSGWQLLMPKTPASHLASMLANVCPILSDIADDDRETRIRRCDKQAREAVGYLGIEGKLLLEVLERVVVYENVGPDVYLSRRDYQALKAALGRLVKLWKIPRDDGRYREDRRVA